MSGLGHQNVQKWQQVKQAICHQSSLWFSWTESQRLSWWRGTKPMGKALNLLVDLCPKSYLCRLGNDKKSQMQVAAIRFLRSMVRLTLRDTVTSRSRSSEEKPKGASWGRSGIWWGCLLDASLWRYSRHVQFGGDLWGRPLTMLGLYIPSGVWSEYHLQRNIWIVRGIVHIIHSFSISCSRWQQTKLKLLPLQRPLADFTYVAALLFYFCIWS